VGWRVIFLVNLPIAAAAGYLSWRYVEERKEARNAAPLDAVGAALATLALGLLTWALTKASESLSASAGSAVIAGSLLLAAFLWHERRMGDRAIMPLAMFAAPTFVGLTLLTFFLYGSLGGLLVLLPFVLIRIGGWLAISAGAALLPVPVLIGLGSRFMGRFASRYGERMPLAIGSGLVGLGLALYARIGAHGIGYWPDVFPPTLLVALGMGACVAPLTTALMASVDADHVGRASGFNNAMARIAGLVATASLGFVFARQDSAESFVAGIRTAALIGAASAVLAAAFALFLIHPKPATAHAG
jgi:MFS family permease